MIPEAGHELKPTARILKQRQKLLKKKYNTDLDNQDEDSYTDEEEALQVTIQKCKEAT